jgi:hypothetical protein
VTRRWDEDRRQAVVDAFKRLTPSKRTELILCAPELFSAVARFVRQQEEGPS